MPFFAALQNGVMEQVSAVCAAGIPHTGLPVFISVNRYYKE